MKNFNTLFTLLILTVFSFTNITAYGSNEPGNDPKAKAAISVMTSEVKSETDLLTDERIEVEVSPATLKRAAVMTFDNSENAPLKIVFTDTEGAVVKKIFTNNNQVNLARADFEKKGVVDYRIYKTGKLVGNGTLVVK